MLQQYRAVRENCGLIDRSDIGRLAIVGPDRFTWLQGMVSNDTRLLAQGAPRLQACILDPTGHVLSDVALVNVSGVSHPFDALNLPESDFVLLEVPRINLDRIATLLDRFLIMEEAEILDVSAKLGCLSVQGPEARSVHLANNLSADTRVFIVQADHTGSGGFDIYFTLETVNAEQLQTQWNLPEIGTEVQEILRIEAGIPKYGAELDESVIALEANLSPTHISFTKGCYVGQEIIARIDSRGHTNRALTGLVIVEGTASAPGWKIFPFPTAEEEQPREIGRITSVAADSPAAGNRPFALGYVRHEYRQPGTRLRLVDESAVSIAEVVELPLYRNSQA